jgi:hypothetical protein
VLKKSLSLSPSLSHSLSLLLLLLVITEVGTFVNVITRAARWSSILSQMNAVRIHLRSIATSGPIRSSHFLRRGYPGIAGSNTVEGMDVYLLWLLRVMQVSAEGPIRRPCLYLLGYPRSLVPFDSKGAPLWPLTRTEQH